jgi:hypothetical protein
LKHSRQYTGMPSVGLKGTWHGCPQSLQTASNISLSGLSLSIFSLFFVSLCKKPSGAFAVIITAQPYF